MISLNREMNSLNREMNSLNREIVKKNNSQNPHDPLRLVFRDNDYSPAQALLFLIKTKTCNMKH